MRKLLFIAMLSLAGNALVAQEPAPYYPPPPPPPSLYYPGGYGGYFPNLDPMPGETEANDIYNEDLGR